MTTGAATGWRSRALPESTIRREREADGHAGRPAPKDRSALVMRLVRSLLRGDRRTSSTVGAVKTPHTAPGAPAPMVNPSDQVAARCVLEMCCPYPGDTMTAKLSRPKIFWN